jgi:hypothetical protein
MMKVSHLFRTVFCALLVASMLSYASEGYADESASSAVSTTSGDYNYTLDEDGAASIICYNGSASELTVPHC